MFKLGFYLKWRLSTFYVLCKYLCMWPVTETLDSIDVIILASGEGGGQMLTTVLLTLAVAK